MIVLDSSALLAVLLYERGGDVVVEIGMGAMMSCVNYTEVISKVLENGGTLPDAVSGVRRLRPQLIPFDIRQAERAGELRPITASLGLSLGDRACIALAEQTGAKILTADRRWAELKLDVAIQLIR